jgi:hypothetical protein
VDPFALGFGIAFQVGLIALGTWLFQEPERRLVRRKGLWPGLWTYTWVAAVTVVAGEFAGTVIGGLIWWALAMTVLDLTFRQTLMIGVASLFLFVVLAVLAGGFGPVPEPVPPG